MFLSTHRPGKIVVLETSKAVIRVQAFHIVYSDLIGFYSDLMGYKWDLLSGNFR